jgi:hypothetical protein
VAAGACLVLSTSLAGQQVPVDWDPARLQVTRAELEDLLNQYQSIIESAAYSEGIREQARRSARRIEHRLEEGDFRVGDRITLRIEGQPELISPSIDESVQSLFPNTLIVEPGPAVIIEGMDPISLEGVLRSELQAHMTEELSRYIRDPEVSAQALIRLSVEEAVANPGFYTFRADMLLGDVLMAAGGPAEASNLEEIEIRRGEEVLMQDENVQEALAEGRSLDQLGLRAGDRIQVPAEEPNTWVPTVVRWGAIIVSTAVLGIRLF